MISWTGHVEEHSYHDAKKYLALTHDDNTAHVLVHKLRSAPVEMESPEDLLRASGREPAPDDGKMKRLKQLVAGGRRLSPVLFVSCHGKSDIADGYHRTSLAAQQAASKIPVKKVTIE